MEQLLKNFGYYLILPALAVIAVVWFFYIYFLDLEKSVNTASTLVQTFAIVVGGLWAYRKFDWNKRAESAIQLKAMLMDYEQTHNIAAMQYRIDQSNKVDKMDCWTNFSMKMIPARNNFASQIHLSMYIPKKMRQRLFDVVWLSINKGRGPQNESIDDNWKAFSIELEKVKKELDNLVSK